MQFSIIAATLALLLTAIPAVSAAPSPSGDLVSRAVARSRDGSTTCYANWRQKPIKRETYDRLVRTLYKQVNRRGELSDNNGACCGGFCLVLEIGRQEHTIPRRDVERQVRKLRRNCVESSRADEGKTTFKGVYNLRANLFCG